MMRLLLAALLFETGFLLMVVPWSAYWDRNYFAESIPLLHAFVTNNFTRGAVSGLGVVNVVAGALELLSVIAARRVRAPIVSISRSPVEE
jgi:polyferredoxin